MKKALIITIIMAVILLAGGIGGTYYYMNKRVASEKAAVADRDAEIAKKNEELSNASEKANKKTNPATQTTQGVKYANSTFGFELSLPSTWKEYGVSESLYDDEGAGRIIYFGLPHQAADKTYDFGFNRYYGSPFALSIFTKDQWQKSQNQEGPKPIKITENDTYVYAYSPGNGIVGAKGFTESQLQTDVKTIVASFKLI